MDTLEKDAILISLLEKMEEQGSWCGETHIQKSVYFLQKMLSVPTGFEYILYKHGPFSFDLRDELTSMRANMFLKLRGREYPYGPSYSLGPMAQVLIERFSEAVEPYSEKMEFVAKTFSSRDSAELERLATAFYVRSEEGSAIPDHADYIHEIKPHISRESAASALLEVEALEKTLAGP